jgi:GntR family carbon starvation induced transcriptional regulator
LFVFQNTVTLEITFGQAIMKRSVTATAEEEQESDVPRTVAEAVYRRLRQDIVWGRLPPEARLRFDDLRRDYDVGISPLREALSRLAVERLVTAVGQRGFRVAPLTREDVVDAMEARLVLEREALTRSIADGGIAWETNLVASFHPLSRSPAAKPGPEGETWARIHRRFHMALVEACGSRWLLDFIGLLFDQAERHRMIRAQNVPPPKLIRDAAAEHKRLFDAALGRDTKNALAALDAHYRTTAEHVVNVLEHLPRVPGGARDRVRKDRIK